MGAVPEAHPSRHDNDVPGVVGYRGGELCCQCNQ